MRCFHATIFLALLGCLSLGLVDCLPRFIRGRRFEKRPSELNMAASKIPEQYFEQRLDHFNEANTKAWQQRYWMNSDFFDGTGPVFLMIGGEGEENPIWLTEGQWINFAKEFKALCFLVEHRFYGKSHPTEDLSVANLVYLSSEQALADLATFIVSTTKSMNLTENNRWVSFGGSYPGSLSAWFRLKYPHLVYAAVASSAPMLAKVNFTDYLVVVNQSLNSYDPQCTALVKQADQQVQGYMKSAPGRNKMRQVFQTCDYPDEGLDTENFFSSLAGNFEGAVQYNKDNRAFEGAIDTKLSIDYLCNIMLNESIGDVLDRYAAVNFEVLDTYGENCLDTSYESFIEQMKQVNWNESAAVGGRQWTYQTCVEFGFFQSTDDQANQPFGPEFSGDFFIQQCTDIFGPQFNGDLLNQAVVDTNANYGGYNYQGSRVVFVNGQIDPWHALGFTQQPPNENTEVVYIQGTAHCADMYPTSDNDPPQLTAARLQIRNYLSEWLSK